jgi:hypothetical protein
MSRCKKTFEQLFIVGLFIVATLIIGFNALAQESDTPAKTTSVKAHRTTVALSYVSWMEAATIHGATANDTASSAFIGNSIAVEEQYFRSQRFAYTILGSVMFGEADVGGSQNTVAYQLANQHWWGATLSPRGTYRFTPQIESSIGLLALYRSVDLPNSGTATADSGANLNYGVTVDVRVFIFPQWQVRFEIGSLFIKAATYWTFGLGYRF